MVAYIDTEVGYAGKQDTVFTTVCFDVVRSVVLYESTNNLCTVDRTNLLVDKATVVGDG